MCIRFTKWACDRLTEDADFCQNFHFNLGRYISKQNCRIWGTEKPTHLEAFFFENGQGEAVTVNGDRYGAMLNEFLFTKIEEEDIGNIWFQQYSATCHTDEATLDVLRTVFEDRIISRRVDARC